MSKIEAELQKALNLKTKRNEDKQDYMARLVEGVNDADDDTYNGLSKEALDWFNDACDSIEGKKDIPDFPDAKAEAKEETSGRSRRGSKSEAKDEPKEDPIKVGSTVVITNKRGKTYTGEILEMDDEVIVLDVDGEEEEIQRSRIESVKPAGGKTSSKSEAAEDEDDAEDPIKVGAVVTVTNKRGKTYTGKIVELDDEVIVLDVDGEDEEIQRSRVESIKPAGGKTSSKAEPKAEAKEETSGRSRRGAAKDEAKEDEAKDAKPKRAASGATARMRELMTESLKEDGKLITREALSKAITKEGLEFKENTLDLVHTAFSQVVNMLADAKLLKLK